MVTAVKFMFIKTILIIGLCSLQLLTFGQDTTAFFPWVQDGQLCQINSVGEVKLDSNLTEVNYPKVKESPDELIAYELQNYYGFKDVNGEIIIKAGYEKVGRFKEDFAWVKIDHKRYYYINKKEKPLVNFTFDRCFDFQNGMARVYDKNKKNGHNGFGFINKKGETIIPLQYKRAFDFVNGFALVQDDNLNWWLINQVGEKVQGSCIGMKASQDIFSLNE
jgi:hypothetical protein